MSVETPVTITWTRVAFDRDVDEQIEQDGGDTTDYSGWFCVRTNPFPCPADGCDFVALFMTAAHLVVVWPEKDDRTLLQFATDAQRFNRNPRIVEWEPGYGPCISYYRWTRIGRPVHGKHVRPEGWKTRPNHE